MFDYLQQFENLPKDLKDKISSKEAMASLAEIESRYRVDLAMIVMKVMIKGLSIKDLPSIFAGEFSLTPEQATKMTQELKEKIFSSVADYVGLSNEQRSLDLSKDINLLIKEAGLAMPSEFLIERLKKILTIYLRGVRSRIDTRASLAKDIATGGLNLTPSEVDQVLKVCDSKKFKYHEEINSASTNTAAPISRLDRIVSESDGLKAAFPFNNKLSSPVVEYDLKRALASGETKRISAPEAPKAKATLELKSIPEAPKAKATPEIKLASVPHIPPAPPAPLAPPVKPVTPIIPTTPPISPTPVVVAHSAIPASPALARKSILGNAAPSSSRPMMHDVKPAPKIMGPLEEIQFLDLTNFRRLGTTPEEITTKIFNKIKLLEKDGYEKMIAGISAWRKSPVSRLYLRIVQEAVSSGLPLKEALEKREKNNQAGLTLAEIEAIMSLNGKLIF
ncbi:MAG: hypothetical protein WCT50_03910 [Patescibacteria group bacterium]